MNPRPISVKPLENYHLQITFANGQLKIFDCNPYLQFPVFKQLKDLTFFKSAKIEFGTVVWNDKVDICPDTLFLESTLSS